MRIAFAKLGLEAQMRHPGRDASASHLTPEESALGSSLVLARLGKKACLQLRTLCVFSLLLAFVLKDSGFVAASERHDLSAQGSLSESRSACPVSGVTHSFGTWAAIAS